MSSTHSYAHEIGGEMRTSQRIAHLYQCAVELVPAVVSCPGYLRQCTPWSVSPHHLPVAQLELSPPFCHTLPCPCCCARCDHSGKLYTALPHAFWSPDGLLSLLWFTMWTNCSPLALKAARCVPDPDCARSLATVARSAVVSRRSLLACAVALTASALRVPLTRTAEGTCRGRGNSGTGSERK